MVDYNQILNKNMINVFKDILNDIKKYGLSDNNHLYVTFLTQHKKNKIPKWLSEKYPDELTIVIQYEYYDIKLDSDNFFITLSFDDIKTKLKIGYESILSFADPSRNFGLVLKKNESKKRLKKVDNIAKSSKDNVISFSNYKKN